MLIERHAKSIEASIKIITNKDQTTVDMDVNSNDTKWSDISDVDLIAMFEKLDNGLRPISSDLTKCLDKVVHAGDIQLENEKFGISGKPEV